MKSRPASESTDRDRAARPARKVVELESLRGLAALLVVVFHLPRWNALLFDAPFVRHGYVMVDLFFVLSGVVICRAYGSTIDGLKPLLRFQFLRLGRLYPTHLLFFGFFLALETAKYLVARHGGGMAMDDPPFNHNNGTAVWQHLLLVQAIGPQALPMTFNFPAWSIREGLNKPPGVATGNWRDGMQGVKPPPRLVVWARVATPQTARQAPSRMGSAKMGANPALQCSAVGPPARPSHCATGSRPF